MSVALLTLNALRAAKTRYDVAALLGYGKVIFAERVVRQQAGTIDFSGFDPLLTRIDAVMEDYATRKVASPLPTSPAASIAVAAAS